MRAPRVSLLRPGDIRMESVSRSALKCIFLLRPHRQHIARAIAEVEAAAAWKFKRRHHDLPAGLQHRRFGLLQILRIQHDQWCRTGWPALARFAASKAAIDPRARFVEADVIWAPALKIPPEGLLIKALRLLHVGRGQLDVIDAMMLRCWIHCSLLILSWDALSRGRGSCASGRSAQAHLSRCASERLHPHSLRSGRVQVEPAG